MPGRVELDDGDLTVIRFDDGEVLIENDSGSVILEPEEATQTGTLILGTPPDLDPITCPLCNADRGEAGSVDTIHGP